MTLELRKSVIARLAGKTGLMAGEILDAPAAVRAPLQDAVGGGLNRARAVEKTRNAPRGPA